MEHQVRATITYSIDGTDARLIWDGREKPRDNYLSLRQNRTYPDKFSLLDSFTIEPLSNHKVTLQNVRFEYAHKWNNEDKIFLNGFQSWTESKEYHAHESIPRLSKIAESLLSPYGDYQFVKKSRLLHSHSFSYIRKSETRLITFFGSLSERGGYTILRFPEERDKVIIEKDVQGRIIEKKFPILDLFISERDEANCYRKYFSLMGIKSNSNLRAETGFTSWYNYYTDIDYPTLNNCLTSFVENKSPIDYFQVDDGWQNFVGDWLEVNKKFQDGSDNQLVSLVRKIHNHGMFAGLWLAPFICEKKSSIFKNHPDWLLRDENGKPVKAGFNPLWSYTFYALDFYNDDFRNYLKDVFNRVFNEWKFDMVKLDFLYAVALRPKHDKTRGEIMMEAMEFLRELCRKKKILGCGVPLLPSAGNVDYCRIGPDVHLQWENSLLAKVNYRERVSTLLAIQCTIARRQLDSGFFLNDPDVFFLRDEKRTGNRKLIGLSPGERETLLYINCLFGSLIFTSDSISSYSPEILSKFNSIFPAVKNKVLSVSSENDLFEIRFQNRLGIECILFTNLSDDHKKISLDQGLFYIPQSNEFVTESSAINIDPHCSLLIQKIEKPGFAGSTGHLIPGNEWAGFTKSGSSYKLVRDKKSILNKIKVYILISATSRSISINGIKGNIINKGNYRIAEIQLEK